MKILKYVLFLIIIVGIGLAIYIAVQPSTYNISRSAEINAPSAVVHHYVDDYTKWPEWSPWLEQEPDAEIVYGDKTAGVGAYYSWKGEVLGEGNIETMYVSNDSINQVINFIKPYKSTSGVYWNIEAHENTTKVTWGMKGEMGFMNKAFVTFGGGMDKMLGPDYERGLKKLDSVVVDGMKKYTVTDNGPVDHGGGYYLYMTTSCRQDETGQKMAAMFPEIKAFMETNNLAMAGMPFALYEKWDEEAGTTIFSACLPVKEKIVTPAGSNVLCGYITPQKYYKTTLKGDYINLKEAWPKAMEYISAAGYEGVEGISPFEVYVNDPMEYPNPADWTTEIYIAIQ